MICTADKCHKIKKAQGCTAKLPYSPETVIQAKEQGDSDPVELEKAAKLFRPGRREKL